LADATLARECRCGGGLLFLSLNEIASALPTTSKRFRWAPRLRQHTAISASLSQGPGAAHENNFAVQAAMTPCADSFPKPL
jgi:hypothetical protein